MKRAVFFVLPLLILAIDIWRTPVFLNGCSGESPLSLAELVGHPARVGRLSGSDVYVSEDDILADRPLFAYARGKTTGLVVSADLTQAGQSTISLLGPVISRLNEVSPQAAGQVSSLLNQTIAAGEVQPLKLGLSESNLEKFPVQNLYVVIVDYSSAPAEKGVKVKEGLVRVFGLASRDGIDNLIVPCLAVLQGAPKALQFDQFFPILLEAKTASRTPKNIYLSLYAQWSDSTQSLALQEVQKAWKSRCESSLRESVLYHENPRILLVFIPLCLLVSAMASPLTAKGLLIVACKYAGAAYGALSLADVFVGSLGPVTKLLLHVGLLAALAVLFPFLKEN
jgi:hypothetical protein